MNKNLQNKLIKEFPELFEHLCYGFECDDGWYDLIRDLCLTIKENDSDETVRVYRVKEKLGGLRFYIDYGSEEIWDEIAKVENKSFEICERCGKPGKLKDIGAMSMWLKTLCENCNV